MTSWIFFLQLFPHFPFHVVSHDANEICLHKIAFASWLRKKGMNDSSMWQLCCYVTCFMNDMSKMWQLCCFVVLYEWHEQDVTVMLLCCVLYFPVTKSVFEHCSSQAGWCSNVYLAGVWFEPPPGFQLSLLKFFQWSLSPQNKCRSTTWIRPWVLPPTDSRCIVRHVNITVKQTPPSKLRGMSTK
jgi:hypothetical protein